MKVFNPATDMVFTDSRINITSDSLFVALVGEHHDAAKFVPELIAKGLKKSVVTNTPANKALLKDVDPLKLLYVEDTTQYLQDIARERLAHWRKLRDENIVFAITGSNGKTTSKEMLAWLLGGLDRKFHATKGNLNNHIGVPLTILEMPLDSEVLVLEMGTNHPGEIELLCTIGTPDAGYITNVGQSHLEFFHNEDNVFVEKTALYRSVLKKKDGLFILNIDDTRLAKLKGSEKTISIGKNNSPDIQFSDDELSFSLKTSGEKIDFKCPKIPEHHNRFNMAMAVSLCLKIWPSVEIIQKLSDRVESYAPPRNNRSVFLGSERLTIYLDAYNANPSSMRTSLEGFANWLKSKDINMADSWFILGDMNELGDRAPEYHEGVGQLLSKLGVSQVFFIGRYREHYNKGFGGTAKVYENRDQFLAENSRAGEAWGCSAAFIKGSRTLQLEQLVDITLFPVL